MDHHVEVVHENPFGVPASFHVVGLDLQLLSKTLLDGFGDGQDLAIRSPVADQEKIREVATAAKIEDEEVLRLLVPGRLDGVMDVGPQRAIPRP